MTDFATDLGRYEVNSMIPDYQSLMLPLLEMCADGQEYSLRALIDTLAQEYQLAESEKRELLPSGRQPIFDNRVGWAKTYLKKAGLLESQRRGSVCITERGRDVLRAKPAAINVAYLRQFPEFVQFQTISRPDSKDDDEQLVVTPVNAETPEEGLERAYERLRTDLEQEVLNRVLTATPEFFERLVVELLVSMGYGGTRKDAGERVGKSGDGGIDGIIKEDRLGLDTIYLQAKRWQTVVGRPEVQRFVGALQGYRARKGVFITTSGFTREAEEYVKHLDLKVVLIDGQRLSSYMIDFGVGVTEASVYRVMRIDTDYFAEE